LHPALYLAGKTAPKVSVPSMDKEVGTDWTKLEENLMGEFGWKEVLKQFLGEERATPVSAKWNGDRYVVYEHKKTKRLLLIARLDLGSEADADRFFEAYSEALKKKYDRRTGEDVHPDFLSFDTSDGGVFLRCVAAGCVTLEGGSRALFENLNKELQWTALPAKQVQKAASSRRARIGDVIPARISGQVLATR
jgi:hypothetical protein